jgi:hypothetical protein
MRHLFYGRFVGLLPRRRNAAGARDTENQELEQRHPRCRRKREGAEETNTKAEVAARIGAIDDDNDNRHGSLRGGNEQFENHDYTSSDTQPGPNPDLEPDFNTDYRSCANHYADTDTNSYFNTDADSNTLSHGDHYVDSNANSDTNSNSDSNSNSNTNSDSDSDSNTRSHGDHYGDTDTDANAKAGMH